MQKRSSRITAFILTSLLLLAALTACAQSNGEKTDSADGTVNTVGTSEETTELAPSLPTADYEGYTFTFLQWWEDSYAHKLNRDLVAETQTGDVINDAVYARDLKISETYNVGFKVELASGGGTVSSMVTKAFAAGDDSYDVAYEKLYNVPSLITSGALLDLNQLGYVDFSMPWYDQNSVSCLTLNGKLYLVASDINLADKFATSCVMFSKSAAASYNISDPYAYVNSGTWTMDVIETMSKNVSNDIDGDGKMTADDFYGMLGRRDLTTFFYVGGGGTFAETDENGLPVYTFSSEYNYAVVDKVFEILYNNDIFFDMHYCQSKLTDPEYHTLFRDNHCLFYVGCMLDEVEQMRESDLEFGILPNPKYDEAQDSYRNIVSVHHGVLLSVPATAGDTDRTGVIIDALSYESKNTVIPAYYEVALKGKYIRDDESEKMLDIIFGTRVFDLGDICNFGGFSIDFICISTGSRSEDIASFYAKYENAIQSDIDDFVALVTGLDS